MKCGKSGAIATVFELSTEDESPTVENLIDTNAMFVYSILYEEGFPFNP
jgi:hypothetical protein